MAASRIALQIVNKCQNTFKSNVMSIKTVCRLQKTLVCTRKFSCQSVLWNDKPLEAPELKKMMDSLTDSFAEAREMLSDARESQGTVYFSEDLEDAQEAVNGTLIEYKQLLDKLSDTQRQEVISTLGLRMEELKAQQKAIEDELIEDH